jgi:hypothetical protein
MEEGCEGAKYRQFHRCYWHYMLTQPIERQIQAAVARDNAADEPRRARVPEREWPEGTRWCAGCQYFVPLFYARGSRCVACDSRASHGSHVERTYGMPREEYEALLTWQGGRCYICGQLPHGRRLAVDHDHATGAVRGLLCSSDEWGCNVRLARLLNDLWAAYRAYLYVQKPPYQRMKDGEPRPFQAEARRGFFDR